MIFVAKEKFVKVCPICASENYVVDKSNKYLEAAGSSRNYECNNCGTVFPFPVELSKTDSAQLSKEFKMPAQNVSLQSHFAPVGFFFVRFVWKIEGASLLAFAVLGILAGMDFSVMLFLGILGLVMLVFSFMRDNELKKVQNNGQKTPA